jgi:hypothetical protein
MKKQFLCVFCGVALLAACLAAAAVAGSEKKPDKDAAVFDLQEASAFDDGAAGQALARGEYAQCSTEPFKEVKVYPKLNSKQPLYGRLQFGRSLTNRDGVAVYFVLDESGETPAPEVKAEAKADAKDAKAKKPAKRHAVNPKLSSYDRLYFDANRDGDLTNDPLLKPMKHPPWKSFPGYTYKERMAFELAKLDVDYGPGVGVRPFSVFPWIMVNEGEQRPMAMRFAAPVVRKGTIRIGKDEYEALLMQQFALTGRFDHPITSLKLTPKNHQTRLQSFGFESEMLMSMRRFGDQFYTIAASPLGDKLTVTSYRGPFGLFKIGPGDRKLKDLGFAGSFRSETTALGVGPDGADSGEAKTKMTECKLPVGDYLPSYLTVSYGGLQISLSDNYHAEGHSRDMGRRRTYAIRIRADKPFLFDFSNKPAIVFASPATDKPVKLGDDVRVAAVLTDPKLDIMIRRLDDPSKKKKETVKYRVGKEMKEYTYERSLSLDPTVTITNSAGKKVAEGVMPFG